LIRLCTFLDRDPWFKRDSTGHNKVGYLTADDMVIYPKRRHFVAVPLKTLLRSMRGKELQVFQKQCPAISEKNIERFFTENVLNPALMSLGNHKLSTNDFAFFEHPVLLPRLRPIDADEHKRRWEQLWLSIREGDLVQVIDESSTLSRLIAKVDMGTWSHSARYAGNGNVLEAITAGVVERSITAYGDRRYRIGIYRHPNLSPKDAYVMSMRMRSLLGAGYSWRGVTRLAAKKILRLNSGKQVSPNDLMSRFEWHLIHIL
jgi:hypothetical protein